MGLTAKSTPLMFLSDNKLLLALDFATARQNKLTCSALTLIAQFTFQFLLFTLAHSVASPRESPTRTPPSQQHRQTRTMAFGR